MENCVSSGGCGGRRSSSASAARVNINVRKKPAAAAAVTRRASDGGGGGSDWQADAAAAEDDSAAIAEIISSRILSDLVLDTNTDCECVAAADTVRGGSGGGGPSGGGAHEGIDDDGTLRLECKYESGGKTNRTAKVTGTFTLNVARTRSLNAPSPIQQFGPCGRIMKNSAMVMTIQDPASQRLTWYKPPLTVLVIKKIRDAQVIPPFIQLVRWFINDKRMVVFVEQAATEDPLLANNPAFSHIKEKLMTFTEGKDDLTDKIDFIVCLGGDGTLLYASSLFQQSVPPIMAFHLGSLGFLTPFEIDNFEQQVANVLEGHAALTLRSRLRCIVMKKDSGPENDAGKLAPSHVSSPQQQAQQKPLTNLLVLNEVVIDRGPSPYLSNIDLYLDGKLITSVQGDGLIISTPTGSTAYAVAAGASMIHPSVPAIMVTPICPHSLSFRPIVVPAGVELKCCVSPDSRNTAWVSFDGRKRQELCHGDSLRVTTSIYPVPSICAHDQISDWFASLAECLHWNVRKKQKHFDELSDLTRTSSNETIDSSFDKLSDGKSEFPSES